MKQVSEPANGFLSAVVGGLLRWRWVILPAIAVLTILAWPIAEQIEFDQSIESLYAEDDPHFTEYAASKSKFGGDEFAIVAWEEKDLFVPNSVDLSERSRQRVEALATRLSNVEGVYPDSIQDVSRVLAIPVKKEQIAELMRGILIGTDGETTAVIVRLKPEGESPKPRGETIRLIREIAAEHDPPAFVVGEPVQIHDMFRYVEDDGQTLFVWSLALLAAVLMLLFRTLRWVVLPLLIVVLTIKFTEALLVLSGTKLSMVSSMLNSLVTIIGVATATHIAVRFREKRQTMPRADALRTTIAELLSPIFWTCGTTAVGFAALLSSNITPVRSFGLMMSVATLLVFVVVGLVAPGGLARWFRPSGSPDDETLPDPDQPPQRSLLDMFIGDPVPPPAERHLIGVLRFTSRLVAASPGTVAATAVLIVAFSALGLARLQVETDFSRNFRDESDLVQSLNFVETRLGGAGTWEVNFPAPEELTEEYLDSVRSFAADLRAELLTPIENADSASRASGRLTKVVSLTDGLDILPKTIKVNIGIIDIEQEIPLSQRLYTLSMMQSEVIASLYNADERRMRIVLRGLERQPSETKLALIARVDEIAAKHFTRPNADEAKTTGVFVLLTFLIESLLRDQVVSFVIAAVGIGTMMAIAFRSLTIGVVSLLPNLFPIVLVIGSMGWIGLPINIATAMIASVSMGLTVDCSIHYLSAYRRARKAGATVPAALEQTQTQVGRALVFANVALVAGFSVLTLSHFIPLVYFGILVSAAMLGGLAGNLFLLPLLLSLLDRRDTVTTADAETNMFPTAEPLPQPEAAE